MWICLNNAFISAVQHREKPDHLMVRARMREHLAAVFPNVEIIETTKADYRWRVVAPKNAFKKAVNHSIDSIDYDNFKNSVEDHNLHDCYSKVWGVMHRLQYQDKKPEITALDETFQHDLKGRASPYDWQETEG
ncbi:MAG: hypothetical protein ACQ9MH_20920 [Nitrospinales bacterium]